MTSDTDWLTVEWAALTQRLGLADVTGLGQQLIERYSEPHRVFHTTKHLRQVVEMLEEVKADDRLVLAAWFHDAIYMPGATDNEARSAGLARTSIGLLGGAAGLADFVCDAVMATATHVTERKDFALLLDADLSILGSEPAAYDKYRDSVRKEFRAINDQAFRAGRAAFIRAVLSRKEIFRTPVGKSRFEAAARKNMRFEFDSLG